LVYYWFGQKPAPITYEKLITIDIISIPLQEAKEIATQNQFKSYTSLNTTLPSNEPEKREESEVQASIKHPSVTTIKIKKASITIKAKDLASYKIREQLPSNGQSTKRYEQIISQAIEKNISHLQLEKTQSSKVMFKIRLNKKGKVIISSLLESSGNVKIDQLLLNAVQKATYLPSVPQDYPGYAKESLFDFIIPIEIN
jgi:TonB family protein